MAFDVAGARSAGYSDAEILDYLKGDSSFDVNGALKAGYSQGEVVDYLANEGKPEAPAKAPAPAPAPAPAQRAEIPTDPNAKGPAPEEKGLVQRMLEGPSETWGESADRADKQISGAVMGGFARAGETLGVASAVPAIAYDWVDSLISGETKTDAQNWVFKNTVQPFVDAQAEWGRQQDLKTSVDKVVVGLAGVVPDLVLAAASGGTSEEGQILNQVQKTAPAVFEMVKHGMQTMKLPAFVSGIHHAAELIREGVPLDEAVNRGLVVGASTDVTGGLPFSAPGAGVVKRMVTGGAIGAAGGELTRQAENAVTPPERQRPFNGEEAAIGYATGSVMAGTMSHPTPEYPTREELGYAVDGAPQQPQRQAKPATGAYVADAMETIRPTGPAEPPAPPPAGGIVDSETEASRANWERQKQSLVDAATASDTSDQARAAAARLATIDPKTSPDPVGEAISAATDLALRTKSDLADPLSKIASNTAMEGVLNGDADDVRQGKLDEAHSVPPESLTAVNATPGEMLSNGFFQGPVPGEKYRVAPVDAVGGAILFEKRLPGGTTAGFYVGKDGSLIDADNIGVNREEDRAKLWIPENPQKAAIAQSILQEMGYRGLSDPKRAELKRQLKQLVTGEEPPAGAPKTEAAPKTEPHPLKGEYDAAVAEHQDAIEKLKAAKKAGDTDAMKRLVGEADDAFGRAQRLAKQMRGDSRPKQEADAQVGPLAWEKTPFADRIRATLKSIEETNGSTFADGVSRAMAHEAENGKLDEGVVSFRENWARKQQAMKANAGKPAEPVKFEPIDEAGLHEHTMGQSSALPKELREAGVKKFNELGEQLAKRGFRYGDPEARESRAPKDVQALHQQMNDVVNAFSHLAPQRYRQAKGYKNAKAAKAEYAEKLASDALGIDTRKHPGVDTSKHIDTNGVKGWDTPPDVKERLKTTQRFASGLSAIGDMVPGARATGGAEKGGIGVDVNELTGPALDHLAHAALNLKTPVFVDSGAFGNFRKKLKGENPAPQDFDKILAKYDQLTAKIAELNEAEETDYPRPLLVMPDVVGDQAASLDLIRQHADWIKAELAGNLSRPIIPIQKGELSMADAYREVVKILGRDDFIAGIPSNEKAASPEDVRDFLRDANPKSVHILGAASDETLTPRLQAAVDAGYKGEITADASPILNKIVRDKTDRTRAQVIEDTTHDKTDPGHARYYETEEARDENGRFVTEEERPKAPEGEAHLPDDDGEGDDTDYRPNGDFEHPIEGEAIHQLDLNGQHPETIDKYGGDDFWTNWEAGLFADPEGGTVRAAKAAGEPISPEEAKAKRESWVKVARLEGKKNGSRNSQKVVISLFDQSGRWAQPWQDAGYDVITLDIRNGQDITAMNLMEHLEQAGFLGGNVDAILAACPCTDFANSGNRWKAGKRESGQLQQSVDLVSHTKELISILKPMVWAIENPVGQIETEAGLPKPRLRFDPSNYGDPYTKKTNIFGKFNPELPTANVEPTEGSKMHQLRGDSPSEQAQRSETPQGFAYAFFMANGGEITGTPVEMPKSIPDHISGEMTDPTGTVPALAGIGENREQFTSRLKAQIAEIDAWFDKHRLKSGKAPTGRLGKDYAFQTEERARLQDLLDNVAPHHPERVDYLAQSDGDAPIDEPIDEPTTRDAADRKAEQAQRKALAAKIEADKATGRWMGNTLGVMLDDPVSLRSDPEMRGKVIEVRKGKSKEKGHDYLVQFEDGSSKWVPFTDVETDLANRPWLTPESRAAQLEGDKGRSDRGAPEVKRADEDTAEQHEQRVAAMENGKLGDLGLDAKTLSQMREDGRLSDDDHERLTHIADSSRDDPHGAAYDLGEFLDEKNVNSLDELGRDRGTAANDAAPKTAAEWAREMARLHESKPRPLDKLYGKKGPTPEQRAKWEQASREWNREYRAASKNQVAALEAENRARHEKNWLRDDDQNFQDFSKQAYRAYNGIPDETPRIQAARRLAKLVKDHADGKLDDGMFRLHVEMLSREMSKVSETKQVNRLHSERVRGTDFLREKIYNARRTGVLDHDTADFMLWALDKNPELGNDLGISIRKPPEEGPKSGAAGDYDPIRRIMRLFSGNVNPGTGVHELLHHSERMMAPDVQEGIRAEWMKQFGKELKLAKGKRLEALGVMAEAATGNRQAQKELYDLFRKGRLSVEHDYQFVNPSEFWAVNATRIMNDRYQRSDRWIGRARQWLGELGEKVKGLLGLRSDAPILKGLKAVLNGDGERLSREMLHLGGAHYDIAKDGEDEYTGTHDQDGTAERAEPEARGAEGVRGDSEPVRRLTALGIPDQIKREGSAALVGQTVRSSEDLATLAQVHRDPRYETLRVFFTKGDEIVHATAVSSRMPGYAPLKPAGMTREEFFATFRDQMRSSGADGYYLLHNHPSGNPTPSDADHRLTDMVAAKVPGMKAHVVINSNKYAAIVPSGVPGMSMSDVYTKHFDEDMLHVASKPSAFLGRAVSGPDALAALGKSLQKDGYVTLVGTGADNKVRAVMESPSAALGKSDKVLMAAVRGFMRKSGSTSVSLVGSDGDVGIGSVRKAVEAGVLRDAVGDSGRSLRAQGVEPGENPLFNDTPGRNVAEEHAPYGDDEEPKVNVPRTVPRTQRGAIDASAVADSISDAVKRFKEGPGTRLREIGRILRDEFLLAVTPMAVGSDRARAVAKAWANADAVARDQWKRMDRLLADNFTPEQRKKMWEAADEENLLRKEAADAADRGDPPPVRPPDGGLDGLTTEERAAVEQLHRYGEELMQRAKDAGLFEGDGLPYWTPRMAALLDEHGVYHNPTKGTTVGHGITTSSPNLRKRKYVLAEDTEAAQKAKLGDNAMLVRDIRTMPLAMARLERAIAGRELINSIKEMGARSGAVLVRIGADKKDYFTIPHSAAFKTWEPHIVKNQETGQWEQTVDANGDPVFNKVDLWVHKEFEGPLKAIMGDGKADGLAYRGWMALKNKKMSVIMYSPVIHNAVEWARAMPMAPLKQLTFSLYFRGNALRQGREYNGGNLWTPWNWKHGNDVGFSEWRQAIADGLRPISRHGSGVEDVADILNEAGLKPGRSWTAQIVSMPARVFGKAAQDAVKHGVDRAGDFWHNTLLWNRVADLQAGLYGMLKEDMINKGMDAQTAGRLAAHWANRFAGAVPKEAMSENARKLANIVLFSRSFTLGNLGAMKDVFTGLPKDIQAQIRMDAGELALKAAKTQGHKKAIGAFILDTALMVAANNIAQDIFKRLRKGKSWGELGQNYLDRMSKVREAGWKSFVNAPFSSLGSILSTSTNEPGRQDRVYVGDNADGTGIYMRSGVGKLGEEYTGWFDEPLKKLKSKLSTELRPIIETFTNDKGNGQRVYDEDAKGFDGFAKNAWRIVKNFMLAQIPADPIAETADWVHGKATTADKLKVLGPLLVGAQFSQGAPGGPQVGEILAADRRFSGARRDILPDVKRAIKDGNVQKAEKMLSDLGMTNNEIKNTLRKLEDPESRLSKGAVRNFNHHATDEERQRFMQAGKN